MPYSVTGAITRAISAPAELEDVVIPKPTDHDVQ